ncbi:TPA: hypothetical protein EYP66_06145, partial [Candidatus Poribacteria bacterium]|nr:hypothetical protein [Candidatus Poribacteria bacterium]
GSAYGIHVVNKYYEDVRSESEKESSLKLALSEVGVPVILAGITTLIGFISLLTSNLSLIKEFGFFTACGVLFATLIAITFLPAVLSLLKVKRRENHNEGEDKKEPTEEEGIWVIRFMDRWAAFVLSREKLIVIIMIIVFISALAGLPLLSREVNMVEYFKKGSEIRLAEELMEEKFGGSIPVQFYVRGDIKNPFVLKQMRMAEKYLSSLPDVNDPQSIATLICELNDVMNDRYTIPETEEGVGNLWFFIEGNSILDQLINSQHTEAVIQAKLGTVETGRVIKVVDAVNRYLENLPKELIKVHLQETDETVRQKLEETRIKRIAEQIALDVKGRMPDYHLDQSKLELIVAKGIQESETAPTKLLAERIADKIGDYFLSDAADIMLEERELEKVKVAFRKSPLIPLLQRGNLLRGNPSLGEVKMILSSNIDKETVAEDPEALDYAAESIAAIISETIREGRVSVILSNLSRFLPQELLNDKEFTSDLKADVWEVNENLMAISKEEYASIFGEENAEKDRIILSIQQAGIAPIYKELDRQLMRSQISSLLIALLLVFLLLWAQFKSIVGGLISVAPIALTILVNFGVMSYLGIPLDTATMMIASIAIGIGIDYTIHFTSRFKGEFAKQANQRAALEKTLETTGVAIVINALSVMMGFLVLMMSSLVPLQRFGWLTALTMFTSALGAITVLPALILLTKARFVSRS